MVISSGPETYLYPDRHPLCMTNTIGQPPDWITTYIATLRNFKNYSNDRIITDLQEVDPMNYTFIRVTNSGASKLDWAEICRFCVDSGYRIDVEEGTVKDIYRFDRKTGYYQSASVDQLVHMLILTIQTYYPSMPLPVSFPGLVEVNVVHRLPDFSSLASTDEFDAYRSYYHSRELIPFRNGIYSLQDNILLPRTSFVFIKHPLNVDFDPAALENEIRERFMEMMCGDENLFELLFEQIGYAMYARTFIIPTISVFYGSGANGKSIVLDLVKDIVGGQNISALSMYDMTNAFSLAQSEGKLLNLSTDSSAGPGDTMIATANTAEFMKKSSSGEMFAFNPKHGKLHNGYGPRKFMFATNVMLKFGGIDEGLARRIYAIPFNATFQEDYAMKKTLMSESTKTWFAMQALISLATMIHRAMEGRMFLSTELTGKYLECKVAQDMKVEQLAAQDTVLDWLSDELGLDIMDKDEVCMALAGQETLYESYCYFCSATRRQSRSRRAFHNTMRTRFGLDFKRTMKARGTPHVWIAYKV